MNWLISLILASVALAGNQVQTPRFQTNQIYVARAQSQLIAKPEETERFEQTYPLNADGRVSVSNINGAITVEAWDNPQVKLTAIKTADSRESLAQANIKIDSRPDALTVETDYDDYKSDRRDRNVNKNLRVDYTLTVPRTAVLDEIEAVNGAITISGMTNKTKASAVNGSIKAINLRGAAELSTVNGTTEAEFESLNANDKISLETVNGQVKLLLPSDANATVKAETVNGSINNDFNLPVKKGEYVGKNLYGRIGTGETQISLESVNGALSINRRSDGRNLNPTTNLLSAGDVDEQGNHFPPRTPRTPPTPRTPRTPPAPPAPPAPPIGKIDAETRRQIQESIKEAMKAGASGFNFEKFQDILKNYHLSEKQLEEIIENYRMTAEQTAELIGKFGDEFGKNFDMDFDGNGSNFNFVNARFDRQTESLNVGREKPKVTIEAKNCAVTVRGWDKAEVRYSYARMTRGAAKTPIEFKSESGGAAISLKITAPENGDSFGAERNRVEVFVPRRSKLKVVTGGEIRLEGISGEINLEGENGAIDVRDSDGVLAISSTGGRMRVIGFQGEVAAKSGDGAISLDGDFQKLNVATGGAIILTLPADTNAKIVSNSDNIETVGLIAAKQNNEDENFVRQIGRGGENFQLSAAEDGKILIRSRDQINFDR